MTPRTNAVERAAIAPQAGFSLLEILVTLLVVAMGLLGLAGLKARLQVSQFESYQRAQAIVLLNDIVDRINANRNSAGCYAFTVAGTGAPYIGVPGGANHLGPSDCAAGFLNAGTKAIADQDIDQWSDLLAGAAEALAGAGTMVGARGCLEFDAADNSYIVTVAWQGMTETFAPPAAITCAQNLYGPETRRRVVWTRVRIASLV
jgi:type IV pilus assembly protein PilV